MLIIKISNLSNQRMSIYLKLRHQSMKKWRKKDYLRARKKDIMIKINKPWFLGTKPLYFTMKKVDR